MSYTISSSNMSIQQKLEQKFGKAGAEKVLAELKQPEHAKELAVLEKLSPDKLDQFLSAQAGNTGNTGNTGNIGGTNFVDNFLGYLDSVASQWFGSSSQYPYTGSSWPPQSSGSGVPQPPPPPPPPPPRQQPQPVTGRGGNSNGNGGTRNGNLFGGISDEFTTYGMPNGYSDITSDVSGQKFF